MNVFLITILTLTALVAVVGITLSAWWVVQGWFEDWQGSPCQDSPSEKEGFSIDVDHDLSDLESLR